MANFHTIKSKPFLIAGKHLGWFHLMMIVDPYNLERLRFFHAISALLCLRKFVCQCQTHKPTNVVAAYRILYQVSPIGGQVNAKR